MKFSDTGCPESELEVITFAGLQGSLDMASQTLFAHRARADGSI